MDVKKLLSHRVYAPIFKRFASQAGKGLEKYGQLVDPNNLSPKEWLEHAMEEQTDNLVYMQNLHARLEEMEKALKFYAKRDNYKDYHFEPCEIYKDNGNIAREVLGMED